MWLDDNRTRSKLAGLMTAAPSDPSDRDLSATPRLGLAMRVLGIEMSCDDTALAVVEEGPDAREPDPDAGRSA